MIDIDHVSFQYSGAEQENLQDFNLQIKKGECVVLTGESGCGKTCVTRLINTLIPHFYEGKMSGAVLIDGVDTRTIQPHDLSDKIGSVFQNPRSQFFSLDTDSEIVFGMENKGMPYQVMLDRYQQTIRELHIEKLKDRNLFDLSGGQKQTIAFASVYALNPDIFVLDEPSSNLDPEAIQELRRLLLLIKAQGKTIVVSEHRLYFLNGIADRIVLMEHGKLKQSWSASDFALFNAEQIKALGLRSYTPTRLELLRKLPMNFFNTKDLSELTTNMMADCSSMESLLSSTIPPLIANGITVTLTCILLAFFDWRLALCVFITVPIAFLIIWLSRNHQKKLFEKQVDAKLAASDQVQEYLEGMKIIKSCGLSGSHFSALDKALLAMKKIAIKVEMAVGVFMSSASMILQAGIGITIFVGAILLASGQIELLPLLMFLLMVTRIYGPILAILANLSSLLNLNVVTSRMRTLLTTPAMDGDGKTVPNCDIELSHVTFAYNQEDVIKDVSCKIPQGSVTALVGPSGSGKSTISKLIARFWDVQKGKITVGGKDIKSMEPESLMSYMSFVFQDVTLFNDTVMNNIRLGNPNATDDQVIAAAKAAYCDEFVREMPDGYQTVLGENGSTLSGGERQRISIARALLKNAPIILLDEATASLDPENEVLVQKAIAKLVEGKTVIMIAHRLRTVVDADQILVLDNGRLVEHGTHDELMKKNGLYHKLFHIQQESLGWAV